MAMNALFAQLHPFPQNIDYPYGYKPSTVYTSDATNSYNLIKNSYIVDCNGTLRPTTDTYDQTKVEAMGFTMLLTAYHGDQNYFDKLFEFYKSKRTSTARNLMAWLVSCDGISDPNCATDGDIDVAFSLIVAYNQWGGNYLKEARYILNIIKNNLMISCGDTILALRPGIGWGGCELTDIQYYTPAFFRIFADVTGDTSWNQLADDSYRILNASANDLTGLVPDWQSVDGIPGGDVASSSKRETAYKYDACRVPWRMSLDYLWNGNTLAKEWCTKVTNWANGVGADNIRDGYKLDGTPDNQGYKNSAFIGGFTVGAMCNSQSIVNNFGSVFHSLNDTYWFNLYTRGVYLFVATGNFWKPETSFVLDTNISVSSENDIDSITTDGGTLQMVATVLPDNAFNKIVEWSVINGTGEANIDENGVLTAVANGNVTVRATAYDGSDVYGEKEITINIQESTGIPGIKNHENNYLIYPNPVISNNILTLSGLKNAHSLNIIDLSGQTVMSVDNITQDKLQLNVQTLTSGSYLIKINTANGNCQSLKMIK